jgi:hypothetical protein
MAIEAYGDHAGDIWTEQYLIEFGYEVCDAEYRVIAVHLEWNLIFPIGEDRTLLAYDMNHRKVHVLPTRAIHCPRPT